MEEIKFYTPPGIMGYYRFGKRTDWCTKISLYHKPNFINRFFMKILLGLYWEDRK